MTAKCAVKNSRGRSEEEKEVKREVGESKSAFVQSSEHCRSRVIHDSAFQLLGRRDLDESTLVTNSNPSQAS